MTRELASLVGALRANAELAEKSVEFMGDPDLVEDAREDADFWRRCAAEMERTGKWLDALLADTLVLMDQTASAEVQLEARRRIIERHGKPPA